MQCHGLDSVEFFGHLHGADLRRKRRTGAADHDDSGDQWSQFARDRNRHHVRDEMYSTETFQLVCALQRHNDADEKSNEGNHRNGGDTDCHRLMDCSLKTQAALQWRSEDISQSAAQELSESADIRQASFCRGSNI